MAAELSQNRWQMYTRGLQTRLFRTQPLGLSSSSRTRMLRLRMLCRTNRLCILLRPDGRLWVTLVCFFSAYAKYIIFAYVRVLQNSSTAAAESNGAADASVANLQIFLDNFVCQANANNTNYFFFEYFDEVWKDVQFGGVEGYWGLFYANRTLKSGITIPDCSS